MKIAVFGYYNALNAGDDRLQVCLTRLLQGHTIVFLPHYLPPPKDYLKTFDWILIGGGGLIFEKVGIWENVKQWAQQCTAKIGVLGIGVNRVEPDLLKEVLVLIERSEFFCVRDAESKALLDDHSKVTVLSDLSWCYPLQSNRSHSNNRGVALNLLPCSWKTFNPDVWVQNLSDYEILPFPFHFGKGRDADLLRQYFGDRVPEEFSLQPLLDSEILVACRFHAIIFAMQLGKPFVAINYDHKVQRLLADADLSECCLETTDHELISRKIQFVQEHQNSLKQKADRFVQQQQVLAQDLTQVVHSAMSVPSQTVTHPLMTLKRSARKLLQS